MALITGSPAAYTSPEELYIEGAPYMFFQDASAAYKNAPDADGFYWGLQTGAYTIYEIGCLLDVKLGDNIMMNDVRCDQVGVKSTIQKRNYLEFTFTVQNMFSLAMTRQLLKLSTPTVKTGFEKVGIGSVNNNVWYHVYAPVVYDPDTGDLLMFNLHRCQFVDAFNIDMTYGQPWKTAIKLRAFADSTKVDTQKFGVIIRSDASALP